MILKKITILFLFLVCLTGCATLKEYTIPANFEPIYNFQAYSVKAPENPVWRFKEQNKYRESLCFVNADNYSYVFLELIPVSKQTLPQETDIVQYFQDKTLKEFKLSPDIILANQDIQRAEIAIGGNKYKILTLLYEIKKEKFEFSIYYYYFPQNEILYTFALLTNKDKTKTAEDKEKIVKDFYQIIEGIRFKTPKENIMIRLRTDYAFSDFADSAQDKYLKEKITEIKKKYDFMKDLLNNWLKIEKNNYQAYNLLGYMATYNDKFERYGAGFNYEEALGYFQDSIRVREYYKPAHLNLAELYSNTGNIDKVIDERLFITKLAPNDSDNYYELGKLYEKKSDIKSAKLYYKKAIRYWVGAAATLEELKSKMKGLGEK